jgi:molybdopterin-guanine dinucleotide biosynthesis protein A
MEPAPLRRVIPGLGGVVLAGGKSSRMGSPKAWLDFGGEALLQRVVRRVAEVAAPVVVVAAEGQDVPPLPEGVAIVRDPVAGKGPLVGIAAGLDALAGCAEAAFVSSTDAPFLHPALIRRLAALRAGYDIAAPRALGHLQPLCAVYAMAARAEIAALLAEDRLRLTLLFERARTLIADEALLLADPDLAAADPGLRSLRNVNTREEYAAALGEDKGLDNL